MRRPPEHAASHPLAFVNNVSVTRACRFNIKRSEINTRVVQPRPRRDTIRIKLHISDGEKNLGGRGGGGRAEVLVHASPCQMPHYSRPIYMHACIEGCHENFSSAGGPKLSHVFCYLPKITGLQETQRRREQSTRPCNPPRGGGGNHPPPLPPPTIPRGRYHGHLPPNYAPRRKLDVLAKHQPAECTIPPSPSHRRLGRDREIE